MTEAVYAHYFYVLKENEKTVSSIWSYLVKRYGLEGQGSTTALRDQKEMAQPEIACTLHGDRARLCLLPLAGLTAIELFCLPGRDALGWQAAEDEIAHVKSGLTGVLDDLLGEARVFIGSDREIADLLAEGDWQRESLPFVYQVRGGTLYFLQGPPDVSTYAFEPGQSLQALTLLTNYLPTIDATVHKLSKMADYFASERDIVERERTRTEKELSLTLHAQATEKESGRDRIRNLEEQVSKMASIYAKLAGYASMLKDAEFTISRELARAKMYTRNAGGENTPLPRAEALERFSSLADSLRQSGELLAVPTREAATAVDVLRAQIDILRSQQNIELQEEGLALQVGAGFVEFILVYYYSLASWAELAGLEKFEAVSSLWRGLLVLFFAASVVGATHQAAKYSTGKKVRSWVFLAAITLPLIIVASMIGITLRAE